MIEPMQREYELARIAGIPECARLLAAYREELLAASAQSADLDAWAEDRERRIYSGEVILPDSAEPQEAEAQRHEIRFIDATPDEGYIRRILEAYIDDSYYSDNTAGLPPENEVCKMMNKWREERNALLRAALARLASKPSREEGPDLRTALDLLGEIMSYAETWANLPQNLRNRAEAYLHPSTEFVKLPKVVRDNYLEMAAELAVIHGL
jgi:hypothetical protein